MKAAGSFLQSKHNFAINIKIVNELCYILLFFLCTVLQTLACVLHLECGLATLPVLISCEWLVAVSCCTEEGRKGESNVFKVVRYKLDFLPF